jgi:pyruvate dehydrogenase (quinone)
VVIMCGAGCRGAADLLGALPNHLKAPLVHSVRGKELMAYDDPRWMGGLGIIGTKTVYNAVRPAADGRHRLSLFQFPASQRHGDPDRRTRAGAGSPRAYSARGYRFGTADIGAAARQGSGETDTLFGDNVTHERPRWDEMLDKQADLKRSKDRIHPQAVARALSDLARPDATFVFDTGLNTLRSANWIRQTGSQRIIGSFNNAAVGTAPGQANGIQALDRSRQVIALTGDGGFNMLMGEFMTAVHHNLPVKVIIYNNSALGLITLEAESVGLVPFREAIEFPNPDFAALARTCSGHGFMARKPNDLMAAIAEALAVDGPAIVRRHCGSRRDAEHAACRTRSGWALCRGQDQGSRARRHRRVTDFNVRIAQCGLHSNCGVEITRRMLAA